MKRIKLTHPKLMNSKRIQTTEVVGKQSIPKKSNQKDIKTVWTAIQKKEKELINKHSPQAKQQRKIITDFLRNHQINPQTGYVESKWKEKTHFVSCGSKVIK